MFAFHLWNTYQLGPPEGAGPSALRYLGIILVVAAVLIVAILLYRLLLPDLQKVRVNDNLAEFIEKKKVESMKSAVPGETGERSLSGGGTGGDEKSLREAALRFLDADERKVIEALLETKGSMLQKEISWKTGFSRVKTHRVLARLIRRGAVAAEKYYNTNRITISKSIFDEKDKPN